MSTSVMSSRPVDRAAAVPVRARGHVFVLAGICVVAAVLYSWRAPEGELGNTYYAAAVKSMLVGPTNFLFGAADPHGAVSVDKPPLALWVQAGVVSVFGFSTRALFLPQILAGVATVFVLHRAVRRWTGEVPALVAAAVMATTPVTVALNRHNNTDTLLILFLVSAAWAMSRALDASTGHGRRWWVIAAAALIGLGFNTKMLEAWIVVPAFAGAVLLGVAGVTVKERVGDLVRAAVTLVAVSFSWVTFRDLWPGEKPYMGGSVNDSAYELVFGYNGFGALFGNGQAVGESGLNVPLAVVGLFGGRAGLGRMFSPETGGQIAWLLPLCALVLLYVGAGAYVAAWRRSSAGANPYRGGWVLWGGWLVTAFLVLSFTQGIFNSYYVSLLVPAVGAILGAGLVLLWRDHLVGGVVARRVLGAGVILTAVTGWVLVSRSLEWHGWIRWAVLVLAAVAFFVVLAGGKNLRQAGLVVLVSAFLSGQAMWAVGTAAQGPTSGGFPKAGPVNQRFEAMREGVLIPMAMEDIPFPPLTFADAGTESADEMPAELLAIVDPTHVGPVRGGGFAGADLSEENRAVISFASDNSNGRQIDLLVEGGGLASSEFILDSDSTVVGMGGFLGADPVPSTAMLSRWSDERRFRFVLSAAPGEARIGGLAGMGGVEAAQRVEWVHEHCTLVPPDLYAGTMLGPADDLPIPSYGDAALFDCG